MRLPPRTRLIDVFSVHASVKQAAGSAGAVTAARQDRLAARGRAARRGEPEEVSNVTWIAGRSDASVTTSSAARQRPCAGRTARHFLPAQTAAMARSRQLRWTRG
jgi:hypothetical protein